MLCSLTLDWSVFDTTYSDVRSRGASHPGQYRHSVTLTSPAHAARIDSRNRRHRETSISGLPIHLNLVPKIASENLSSFSGQGDPAANSSYSSCLDKDDDDEDGPPESTHEHDFQSSIAITRTEPHTQRAAD